MIKRKGNKNNKKNKKHLKRRIIKIPLQDAYISSCIHFILWPFKKLEVKYNHVKKTFSHYLTILSKQISAARKRRSILIQSTGRRKSEKRHSRFNAFRRARDNLLWAICQLTKQLILLFRSLDSSCAKINKRQCKQQVVSDVLLTDPKDSYPLNIQQKIWWLVFLSQEGIRWWVIKTGLLVRLLYLRITRRSVQFVSRVTYRLWHSTHNAILKLQCRLTRIKVKITGIFRIFCKAQYQIVSLLKKQCNRIASRKQKYIQHIHKIHKNFTSSVKRRVRAFRIAKKACIVSFRQAKKNVHSQFHHYVHRAQLRFKRCQRFTRTTLYDLFDFIKAKAIVVFRIFCQAQRQIVFLLKKQRNHIALHKKHCIQHIYKIHKNFISFVKRRVRSFRIAKKACIVSFRQVNKNVHSQFHHYVHRSQLRFKRFQRFTHTAVCDLFVFVKVKTTDVFRIPYRAKRQITILSKQQCDRIECRMRQLIKRIHKIHTRFISHIKSITRSCRIVKKVCMRSLQQVKKRVRLLFHQFSQLRFKRCLAWGTVAVVFRFPRLVKCKIANLLKQQCHRIELRKSQLIKRIHHVHKNFISHAKSALRFLRAQRARMFLYAKQTQKQSLIFQNNILLRCKKHIQHVFLNMRRMRRVIRRTASHCRWTIRDAVRLLWTSQRKILNSLRILKKLCLVRITRQLHRMRLWIKEIKNSVYHASLSSIKWINNKSLIISKMFVFAFCKTKRFIKLNVDNFFHQGRLKANAAIRRMQRLWLIYKRYVKSLFAYAKTLLCTLKQHRRKMILRWMRSRHKINRLGNVIQYLQHAVVLQSKRYLRQMRNDLIYALNKSRAHIGFQFKQALHQIKKSSLRRLDQLYLSMTISLKWTKLCIRWVRAHKRYIHAVREIFCAGCLMLKSYFSRIAPIQINEIISLNISHIRNWAGRIHRKKEIVMACGFIVIFLPVIFLKVMRNGLYSLITHNSSHNPLKKIQHPAWEDGLLCFNDASNGSFDYRPIAIASEMEDNSYKVAHTQPQPASKSLKRKLLTEFKKDRTATSATLAVAPSLFSSEPPPVPASESKEWMPQRVFLSNTQETDDGFGEVNNYWTLDVLTAPLFQPGHFLPMIDVRWHEFSDDRDSNRFAANVGFITRYIPKSHCAPLIGGNIYYDYRHSTIGKGWNRLGLGMEVLGKRWDFRLNGYFPIGGKLHKKKCTFDDFEGGYYMIQRKYEFMFTGFNAEIGANAVLTKNWLVYLRAGPYYLNGKCDNKAWGAMLGIRPQFKDYIALDLSVSHDHIFNTVYQGQIIFSLPLYSFNESKKKTGPCGITQRQIYQPVERFDIIPVKRDCCWEQNF